MTDGPDEQRPERQPTDGFVAMSDERMAELTELAIRTGVARTTARPRRGRRRFIVGSAVTLALTSGTAAAAAVLWSDQPEEPAAGTVCRGSEKVGAVELLLGVVDDPIASCREVWRDERFPEFAGGEPWAMAACVHPSGSIVVIPGDVTVCGAIGQAVAEQTFDETASTLLEVNHRVLDSVNRPGECRLVGEVRPTLERILSDLKIDTEWRIELTPGITENSCVIAGVDGRTARIFISTT